MKKIYTILGTFLLCFFANAQMYVSPNTYLFASNEHVYVTGDVELNASTSNIYLRNDAQLLQGTAGAGANKGVGDLSVYQEGTVNNYLYNYWCSPVGNTLSSTAVNNPFGISQLKQATGLTTFSYTPYLPSGSYDGTSSPLQIASRWIYTFSVSNAYAQWNYIGGANTIGAGSGFTMKGTTGGNQRYDFRGKPNDGTITIPVALNNFTLVGNPYPSAIDLNMYLSAANNPQIDGTAYFWEQSNVASHYINAYQGGYGKYTIAGGYLPADIWSYNSDGSYNADTGGNGVVYQRRFTPIGQGFMVRGNAAGNTIMRNSFRVFVKEGPANLSEFARTTQGNADQATAQIYDNSSEYFPEIPNVAGTDYTRIKKGYAPQLRINAIVNNNGIVHTALGFGDMYTDGLDHSADARATNDDAPYNFYYILNGQTNEYAMSIDQFDINKKYPIGLRNNVEATFKIKVGELLYGFDPSQNVYIHDKSTDLYYDIKNSEFQMTLPAGNVKDRFEITFKESALSTNENTASSFVIFQNNENSLLTIKNPLKVNLASCTLYDVTGKTIFSKLSLGSNENYEFATSGLSDGVYIVKLIAVDHSEVAKKVAISHKK